jgi:hypothetical protein
MRKVLYHKVVRRWKARFVKLLAYAFLAFLSVGSAQAQSITGVSGTGTHGATMTITGTGFGTKSPAAPVAYDDFSGGDFDSAFTESPVYNPAISLTINDDDIGQGPDIYCAMNNFDGDGANRYAYVGVKDAKSRTWYGQYSFKMDANNFDWGTTPTGGTWTVGYYFYNDWRGHVEVDGGFYYCIVSHTAANDNRPGTGANWTTYWSYQGPYNSNLMNIKMARWWNSPSYNACVFYSPQVEGYEDHSVDTGPGGGYTGVSWNGANHSPSHWAKGIWHTVQFEMYQGTPGTANGAYHVWFDGGQEVNSDAVINRATSDGGPGYNFEHLGWWDSWPYPATGDNYWYMDTVYVDTTWSRVEIGNATAYNDCTRREIQIPRAWHNTEISISLNLGSFPGVAGTYLFVVNSSGTVSPGFALGGGDSGPPGVSPPPTLIWHEN